MCVLCVCVCVCVCVCHVMHCVVHHVFGINLKAENVLTQIANVRIAMTLAVRQFHAQSVKKTIRNGLTI